MRIYITRHGESLNNTLNIIGGNCSITEDGKKYSQSLANYFIRVNKKITIWTSPLLRTKETAFYFNKNYIEIKTQHDLREIFAGDFDNLNINYIKTLYPDIYEYRNNDKLNNRYPNGENYIDLKNRVFKLLNTLNTKNDEILLIIAHQGTCRAIYSYFTEIDISNCIDEKIDLHTLYKFEEKKFIPILL